jgi:elongation factor Ts
VIENERHIAELTAKEEGKPEQHHPAHRRGSPQRLLQGRHLLEQQSVSDDKKTVGQLLKENGVTVKRFVRFSVGA